MNVTALPVLDDTTSSLLSDSNGGNRWWTQFHHLSTASFTCILHRAQQTIKSSTQTSISLVLVIVHVSSIFEI